MSSNLAVLFADEDTPQPLHEFFTDEPEPEVEQAQAEAKAFAEYVGEDPEALHDSWAKALSKQVPLIMGLSADNAKDWWIRRFHPVGHHYYPQGLWKIQYRGETVRWLDVTQLEALYGAWRQGNDELVLRIVRVEELTEGPQREGKPPIDPYGRQLDEIPDRGDHGPLMAECEWIETHDSAFIRYAGSDNVWPTGCWEVNKADCERQLLDAEQVRYVAHEILGMPRRSGLEIMERQQSKARMVNLSMQMAAHAHLNGNEETFETARDVALDTLGELFADGNQEETPVDWADADLAALFA